MPLTSLSIAGRGSSRSWSSLESFARTALVSPDSHLENFPRALEHTIVLVALF